MCPSEDRTRTQADNDSLFFMTNMIPQTQTLNGGPWEVLETYCRTLAAQGINYTYIPVLMVKVEQEFMGI